MRHNILYFLYEYIYIYIDITRTIIMIKKDKYFTHLKILVIKIWKQILTI